MKRRVFASVAGIVILSSLTLGYSGGAGTSANPYQIATIGDISSLIAAAADYSKYFILTADIDLSGANFTTAIFAADTSTSGGFQGTKFTGSFDGDGHTISNFTITGGSNDYIGLFGYIDSGGQARDIIVEDCTISGDQYVGGLAGYQYSSTVSGCSVNGNVSGTKWVGGLVGYKYSGTVSGCSAMGEVTGSGDYVGGLVGYNYSTSISNSYATGNVSGAQWVGGLTGRNLGSGTINQCYAASNVNGTYYVGGLVGSNTGSIGVCYAAGGVDGNGWIGGLVGYNLSSISQCYSIGTVEGASDVGGLVGINEGHISACFWDMNTSGQESSAAGVGLTTAQMQSVAYYSAYGWGGTLWTLPEDDYPHLAWENAGGDYIGNPAVTMTGSGTTEDPWQIASIADLQQISAGPFFFTRYYILTVDMDVSEVNLSPIGTGSDNAFTGTFDGNNHKIKNLVINSSHNYVGLFGYLGAGGIVENLRIENCTISGSSYIGGLAGASYGNVSNCSASGAIGGSFSYVGGLVGYNGAAINRCCSSAMVSGVDYVGGLAGYNASNLSNSYATGSVAGTSYVGGLVGANGSNVKYCYSIGAVNGTGSNVGGLTGYNVGGTVSSCFWDKEASGWTTSAGGTGKTTVEMKTAATFISASWGFLIGKKGNALLFDGMDDYIAVPGYYGIGGTEARTVSLWFKTSVTSRIQELLQWGADATGQLWLIRIQAGGTILVAAYGGGVYSTATVTDGTWHHIAVVLDAGQTNSSQIRLYVDGMLDANVTGSTTINTALTVPVQLGTWYLSSTGARNYFFAGVMDDVCIYDRALAANEISLEYPISTDGLVAHWALDETGGTVAYDTASSYDGTLMNMTFPTTSWMICEGTNYPQLLCHIPSGDWKCPSGVHLEDFSYFSEQWQLENCASLNSYCLGADLNHSGKVDTFDLIQFAEQWLEGM